MKVLIFTFIGMLTFVRPGLADKKSEVQKLLKERIDIVVSLLQKKDMDKKEKDEQIIETVRPIFDFRQMAKLSLGKKYWPGLDKEKQTAFTDLFIARMQESYLEKLDLYSNEEIVYEEPLEVKNKIHVPVRLVSKDNSIDMLYKFYRSNPGWMIYDVEIEGVSVIQTYRTQFDGILKDGSIDDLLAKLETSGGFTIPTAKKE